MSDLLLIASTVYGMASATIANKYIFGFVTASLFTACRFLISGAFLLFSSLKNGGPQLVSTYKKYAIPLISITLLTHVIPAQLKAYALSTTITSKVALIGSLDPFVSALLAWLLFNQQLTSRQVIGMCLGVVGGVIMLVTKIPDATQELFFNFSLGELCALAWVFLNRIGWLHAQKALKHNWFTSQELNGFCMTLGGVISIVLVLAAYLGSGLCLHATFTPLVIGAIAYSLYVGNILSYNWYAQMLKRFNPVFTSLCCMGIPLTMYILGWLLLGEPLYTDFFWSFGFITIGIYIFYSQR